MCRPPIAIALTLASLGLAQPSAPSFRADRVLPSNSARAYPLAPGMLISIYGANLGPERECVGRADPQRRAAPNPGRPQLTGAAMLIYPQELCGVQVFVGELVAGLLYVQDKQINFQVPQDVSLGGAAELKVVYQGRSSSPVRLPVRGSPSLSVEGVARVSGPVWVKVDFPYGRGGVQYPSSTLPADFGCNEIEVRQNGVALPRIPVSSGPMFYHGLPCGSIGIPGHTPLHTGRLPVHLQYRFEKPGTYEMRYMLKKPNFGPVPSEVALQSEWTRFEVLAARPRAAGVPPTDPAEILTDYLPSILGFSDPAALQIVLSYLYDANDVVRRYAQGALVYWPQPEVDRQVAGLIRSKGPTDVIVNLIRSPTPALTDLMLPDLLSNNVLLLHGAIIGVSRALSDPQQGLTGDARTRAEHALLAAQDHVLQTRNADVVRDFAVALGSTHDDRAREALWSLAGRGFVREQSLIAITWHKDIRDLPRLGALINEPIPNAMSKGELAPIPYALHNAYGEAAIPFLESAVKNSVWDFVRTNCARELVIAGRPAGFAFIVDAMEGNRFYKPEMIQFVRDRFPELKGADEATVLGFVKSRAQ